MISLCFNGGPGNCPAKHGFPDKTVDSSFAASMEGRAIARPNNLRLIDLCPGLNASMEGRAIARPNVVCGLRACLRMWLQWRAGQLPGQTSNCAAWRETGDEASMEGRAIARPNPRRAFRPIISEALQWRAGQLPGQTFICTLTADRCDRASMEGRAIARPNRSCAPVRCAFHMLQWRAGQLPGQTSGVSECGQRRVRCFNGGPGNCPAKLGM